MTSIALAWIVQPLLVPNHELIYHWSGSPEHLFAPVFLDIAILWVLLTLVLVSAQAPGRFRFGVWGAILLFAPFVTLKSVAFSSDFRPPHWLDIGLFVLATIAYLLVLLLWKPRFGEHFERIVALATTLLIFIAMSGAFFLLKLGWLAWQSRSLNDPRQFHHTRQPAAAEASKPRIIWIVLDELSYQQVYERRYPGLELPAFDALANQATVFSHVVPAGIMTEDVLPSLLIGQKFNDMSATSSGDLSIQSLEGNKWRRFDQHDTVFQDALDAGYSTAIVGWWNPYCRIMPAVLDQCRWASRVPADHGITPGETLGQSMVEPFASLSQTGTLQVVLGHLFRLPPPDSAPHAADYEEVFAAADKVLDDRTAGFVLLHLPIPHPLGIYNRATGQLTTGPSTYIDNLALADRYLAHVRSKLEQAGEWDSSALVIMGDHGWRTQLIWRLTPGWMPEDERASQQGQFDDRPGYIVKLAGQQKGDRIDLPFHAVDTRRLLDELIHQRIDSADALHSWVQQTVDSESAQAKR